MQNNNNVGLDSQEFCGENDILPDAVLVFQIWIKNLMTVAGMQSLKRNFVKGASDLL